MRTPVLRYLAALALAGFALLSAACGKEDGPMAGGWTDTETGTQVTGRIDGEDGAAAGARVSLRPVDWLAANPAQPDSGGSIPAGVREGTCDAAGRFAFDSVPPGEYRVEARGNGKGALLALDVPPRTPTLELAPAALGPLGTIRGRVVFSDGAPGAALVRVYGLERAVLADPATGVFTVDSLPDGVYDLHVSGLEPFILPVKRPGVAVAGGALTDAGYTLLQRKLKQAYREGDGGLDIPGVDSTNPVVFENGAFLNPVDGAYLWAKASLGRLDLRGTIATYGKDTGEAALQANLRNCRALSDAARASGLRGVLDPVAGARRPLDPAPSGRLEDIAPAPTQGGLLLIREAYAARSDKPLLVVSGAGLTTVAEALLRDPAIANRMVVLAASSGTLNRSDSLAIALVARKARLVQWARDYYWDNRHLPQRPAAVFPANRLGDLLRRQLGRAGAGAYWSHGFFADFGAATFLYDRAVWSTARAGYVGPVPRPAGEPFDFVDIPREANDWKAMERQFYGAVLDPAAYHPWPVPGTVAGGAYRAHLGARPAGDSVAPGPGAVLAGPGSWVEYALAADTSGTYRLTLRARSDAASALRLSGVSAGRDTLLALAPTVETSDQAVFLRLGTGPRTLRLEAAGPAVTLEDLRFERADP